MAAISMKKISKQMWISFLAVLLLVSGIVLPAKGQAQTQLTGFEDIEGHWGEPFIVSLQLAGILEMPEDKKFRPDQPVTRLDFAVWVAKGMELAAEQPTETPFQDWERIPEKDRGYVYAAVKEGLINGFPDGTFRPSATITRAQLATIFGRALVKIGVKEDTRYFAAFADPQAIPEWAAPASADVKEQIILGRAGVGRQAYFAPGATSSRAEAATMVSRFLNKRVELLGIEIPRVGEFVRPKRLVASYYVNTDEAFAVLQEYGDQLDMLIYTGYVIGTDGTLHGNDSPRTMSWAAETNTPLLVMFGNHNTAENHEFLSNPAARATAINNIKRLMERGYAGVNLDFEMLKNEDRDLYSSFVAEVANALKPMNRLTTVAVMARTARQAATWAKDFDYNAIGRSADYVMVMTYDQHWNGSEPGPIGGKDWMIEVMDYATQEIAKEKLLLGIPSYGRAWPLNGNPATSITAKRAEELIRIKGASPVYNPVTAEISFNYVDDEGQPRIAYYTDARGLQEKLKLIEDLDLGGMAMWRLGYETPDWWQVIRQTFGN